MKNIVKYYILINNARNCFSWFVQDAQKVDKINLHFAEKSKSIKKRIEIIAFLVYN